MEPKKAKGTWNVALHRKIYLTAFSGDLEVSQQLSNLVLKNQFTFRTRSSTCSISHNSAMEVVAAIVSSAVVETGRLVFGSYPNINNFIRFHSILKDLKKEMRSLLDLHNKVKDEADSADDQIRDWLKEVEQIVLEVNSVQADAGNMTANNGKLCGCIVNFRGRYNLSKEMARLLKEVERLLKAGNFTACLPTVEYLPVPSIEYQATASQNLAKLMSLLNNNEVQLIGVWGMGGVGKTTLIKNLNNKLKSDSSTHQFSIVIWATVSKDFVLKNVQKEIAKRLELKVETEESEDSLAKRFHKRLQKEKFLLILDDVWKSIDLYSLGIPQPKIDSGSKIIVTSRSLNVCRQMDTQPMKVDILNDEEAWDLFSRTAKDVATLEHIESTAREVAKECGGLPLAIKVVGAAMRGKTTVARWKVALNELQLMSAPDITDIEAEVYKSLKVSYDLLQNENMKHCFLYCSLYAEDYPIEVSELIRCWQGEGLIKQKNFEDSFNKGIDLIESLKESCMLELGKNDKYVKMHDVVRDVAIWISSSEECGCKSLVRSGIGLTEISEVELKNQVFKRVSFMRNNITRLPDCGIHCPDASTLMLQGNGHLKRIPGEFLLAFESLLVLNISGTHIESLPQSVHELSDLRVLLLNDCESLKEISQVGELRKLEVLDCSSSGISELPRGMENLRNLRELKLSGTKSLKIIPAGIISRLIHLEVLDMIGSVYVWVWKQEKDGETRRSLEELGCLQQLRFLALQFGSLPSLGYDLIWTNKLKSFRFHIGADEKSVLWNRVGRNVTIREGDFFVPLLRERIGCLFNIASSVSVYYCKELNQMFKTLGKSRIDCFANLKSLNIVGSIISLGPAKGSRHAARDEDLLPNLEELHLRDLTYLESISEVAGHLGLRFSRLKSMVVSECPELRHLMMSDGFIQALPNLDKLKVINCGRLVSLFIHVSQQSSVPEPVVPKLRRVTLRYLPKLSTIKESWHSLEEIEVVDCPRLRKLPLTSENADKMKEIRGQEEWWRQLEWDEDDTKASLLPYFKRVDK